jgi:hypothetical protein
LSNRPRRALRGLAVIAVAVGGLLILPAAAHAAAPAPAAHVNSAAKTQITLPVTRDSAGNISVTLPGPYDVGDCEQVQGGSVTLRVPDGNANSLTTWFGTLFTRHTNNRDIWWQRLRFKTAEGSVVAITETMRGPDMSRINTFYPAFYQGQSGTVPSLFDQITQVDWGASC